MCQKALCWLLLIASGLVTVACGPTSAPAPTSIPAASPGPASPPSLPNLLVQAEGEVWLHRVGWNDFLSVGFGVAVEPGDLLRVAEGSTVAVFCGDEALWEASPKPLSADGAEHGIPCQAGRPPRPWSDVSALRGERNSHIPYVLYPRDEAEDALEQALAAAQATGEREAEATARVGLGLAARLLDDEGAAEEHLLAARSLYEQIGDRDRLEQMHRLLTE